MSSQRRLVVILISGAILLLFSCRKDPVVDFTYTGLNNPVPSEVTFSNLSKHAETYKWEFGDGASSTEKDPKHTYVRGGVFNVKLTAYGKGGSKALMKVLKIEAGQTRLDLSIVKHPEGGSQVVSVFAAFDGAITGYLRPIHVTAEWYSQPGAGGLATLKKSSEFVFDSTNNTSKSTVYADPQSYVLVNNYFLKLIWTDDAGQHTLFSDKASCN